MQFPIDQLLDEQACYDFLLACLHPPGLHCPRGHPLPPEQAPHDRHRTPVLDYRCRQCGAVFNVFSGTLLVKSHYPCSTLVLMLRGIAQGVPTKHLAAELHIDRGHLTERRHAIQALLEQRLPPLGARRPRHRGRRGLSQRGREGASASGPRRPTAPTGQSTARSRHMGDRPPARGGGGGP